MDQDFFLSSLRFRTISLRSSKLETVRVWRRGPVFLGVELVVGVGIEAAEAVVAGFVADVAADGVGPIIFQEDDAGDDRANPTYQEPRR